MALDKLALKLLAPRLHGARVLCLGYPDLLAPADAVEQILGMRPTQFTPHGPAYKLKYLLPETLHVFRQAGAAQVDVTDVQVIRGMERVVDLNYPVDWPQQYDIVIDPGTLEHCFFIGQAMFNAWRAVKPGGVVLHLSPMTMVNHGFYNLCPTLFKDFADANGGRVLALHGRDRDNQDVPVHVSLRMPAPNNSRLYVMVEKLEQRVDTMPTQWKYQAHVAAVLHMATVALVDATSSCCEVAQLVTALL